MLIRFDGKTITTFSKDIVIVKPYPLTIENDDILHILLKLISWIQSVL